MSKNSAFVKYDLEGMGQLIQRLDKLPLVIASQVLGVMVKEGAKPVVRNIKRLAPVDKGNLKKSITAVVRRRPKRGTAVAVVGPSTERFANGKRLKKGADARGSDRPANYAHLPEFGFVGRDGKQVPASPYMRPGTSSSKGEAAEKMAASFSKGLFKAVATVKKQKAAAARKNHLYEY
jgi:HK97 gp10 family phage protein